MPPKIEWGEMTTDPFSAFNERVERRLSEMREGASRDFQEVTFECARRGTLNSGMHVRGHLDKVALHLERSLDWALTEARKLPGQPNLTGQQIITKLKQHLAAHLNGLFGLVYRMDQMPSVNRVIEQEREKLSGRLDGELNDFLAGIWHPHSAQSDAGSAKYEIHVGENRGVIQQAGAGSSQSANISKIDGAFNEFHAQLDKLIVAEELRAEILAEVETLRVQAQRKSPNKTVMHAAASGLTQLAYGVAGNLLTPHVITLLAALGVSVGAA